MTLDRYNAFCRSLPHTTTVVQWGGAHVWKVGSKVFAIAWPAKGGPHITFKCSALSFELLRTLKLAVDRDRRAGRFVLTGSANLLLVPGLGDSLAGRMETHGQHQYETLGPRFDEADYWRLLRVLASP